MRKIIFAYFILVVVLILLILTTRSSGTLLGLSLPSFSSPSTVKIKEKTFNVSLAKSKEQLMVGLSKTNKLDENKGMLFIFDKKDYHAFWMKDMKFPIDIIFIDDTKVVDIAHAAQPLKEGESVLGSQIYKPQKKANRVLEINSGLANKYGIKASDTVEFKDVR